MRYFKALDVDHANWRWDPVTDTLWTWGRQSGEWVQQRRFSNPEKGWAEFVLKNIKRGRWQEVVLTYTPATTAEVW
jgi:hypothetical protein